MFSMNFPKIFRRAVLNGRLPMDIPYFIKEHLWMSASDEVTLTKISGGSKPSSKLTLKKKFTTVVASKMILEVVGN